MAQFTAGPVTRVVSGTSWEGTEVIGISNVTKAEAATTNVAYKATAAGSTTNFADQGTKLLLPADKSQVTFAAYYPYASTISEGKASYIISPTSSAREATSRSSLPPRAAPLTILSSPLPLSTSSLR